MNQEDEIKKEEEQDELIAFPVPPSPEKVSDALQSIKKQRQQK